MPSTYAAPSHLKTLCRAGSCAAGVVFPSPGPLLVPPSSPSCLDGAGNSSSCPALSMPHELCHLLGDGEEVKAPVVAGRAKVSSSDPQMLYEIRQAEGFQHARRAGNKHGAVPRSCFPCLFSLFPHAARSSHTSPFLQQTTVLLQQIYGLWFLSLLDTTQQTEGEWKNGSDISPVQVQWEAGQWGSRQGGCSISRGAECLQCIVTGYPSNPSPLGKPDYPSGSPHYEHLTGSYWYQQLGLGMGH